MTSGARLDSPWGHDLRRLEERIVGNDGDSVMARWEFGRVLLRHQGTGVVAAVVKAHGISRAEINHRMQFAEAYPTDDKVANAVATYPSWRQIVSKALPKPRASQ